MSPEQAAGRRVGPPSDVYSAGMVLYELLAGEHPLRGQTPAETLSNVAAGRLPSLAALRPDLPQRPGRAHRRRLRAAARRPARRRPSSARRCDELLRSGRLRAPAAAACPAAGAAAARAPAPPSSAPAAPAWRPSPAASCSARCRPTRRAGRCRWSRSARRVWAVVPQAGLAWLLGVLAFPVFNVSLSLGAAYLVFAVALFLLTRARPIVALWPALALVLAPLYLTLLAPAGAALLGRVRGPLAAAWAGAGTLVYLLLLRAPRGPVHALPAALARSPATARRRRRPVHRGGAPARRGFCARRACCRWSSGRASPWRSASPSRAAASSSACGSGRWRSRRRSRPTASCPIAVWGYPGDARRRCCWNVVARGRRDTLAVGSGDRRRAGGARRWASSGKLRRSSRAWSRAASGAPSRRACSRSSWRTSSPRRWATTRRSASPTSTCPTSSTSTSASADYEHLSSFVGLAQGGALQLRHRVRAARGLDAGRAAAHRPAPRRRPARRRVRHRHAHRRGAAEAPRRAPGARLRAASAPRRRRAAGAPPRGRSSDQTVLYQEAGARARRGAAAAARASRASCAARRASGSCATRSPSSGAAGAATSCSPTPTSRVSTPRSGVRTTASWCATSGPPTACALNRRDVKQAVLQHGDRIELGTTELRLREAAVMPALR